MEFKKILVVLDGSSSNSVRLELAIELAKQYSACLSGLYAVSHTFFESKENEAASHAEQVRADFIERTSRADIDAHWIGVDWSIAGADVSKIVNQHSYYSDLVVVGQDEPGATEKNVPSGLPEKVVLGSGRPVLVVPYAGNCTQLGERVMVTWKPDREFSRAVHDALPFLMKANEVRVVEVNSSSPATPDAELLCEYLAFHGVIAHPEHIVASEISIGDALLNRIPMEGIDLLIMGAYAHTRLGLLVLGDAARHILRHMTVPVLMSH